MQYSEYFDTKSIVKTRSVSPVNLIGDDTFTDSIDLNEVHLDLKMEMNEISSKS